MTFFSFIEFSFSQFSPNVWLQGVSLLRGGAVQKFKAYGELLSARVKTGIGEDYEVRLKLHAQGKQILWFECGCLPNRKKGDKCAHLAAFCCYVVQDQKNLLERLGIKPGEFTKFTELENSNSEEIFGESVPGKSKTNLKPVVEHRTNVLEHFEVSQNGELNLESCSFDDSTATLLATYTKNSSKKLTFAFGVDEIHRFLEQKPELETFPGMILVSTDIKASRHFFGFIDESKRLTIKKRIAVKFKDGSVQKILDYADLKSRFIGKHCMYFADQRVLVRFSDGLSMGQLSRFDEYPATTALNDDIAAEIVQSNFERLRATAEVIIDDSLQSLEVSTTLNLDFVTLKQFDDGHVLIGSSAVDVETGSFSESVLAKILKARAEGKKFVRTKSGWLKLEAEFDWLGEKLLADGQLKMTPLEYLKFQGLLSENSHFDCKDRFSEQLRSGFKTIKDIEFPNLSDSNLNLRSYQDEGYRWLWWLFKNYFSGLLADEMGLGKTHQTMALMTAICNESPGSLCLVVCPTSVIDHWVDKLSQFAPQIEAMQHHGQSRRLDLLGSPLVYPFQGRVVVTSYGILLRDVEHLLQMKWKLVVLDEAHLVKNQTTRTYRAAFRIPSRMRLCLTGTPLENDLMELKNLFDYIAPNYLGSTARFKKRYIAESGQITRELELQRLIHPFKLRRRKKDVLSELPDKIEDTKHCRLNALQYKLYRETLNLRGKAMLELLEQGDKPVPYVHIFSIISLLKQICNDPAIIDPCYDKVGSGKLDLFDSLLEEALLDNQKVVVFSQYAKMVDRLSLRLASKGIKHVTLTGRTVDRGKVIKNFQEDDGIKVFLGSLLAGGTGIDLTSASVVIHYDRWWNAAKENQATDRIHRIGQTRVVQVFKLVTRGTLEERIDQIILKKRAVFDKFVEQDAEIFKHLSRDDLMQLLAAPAETQADDIDIRAELASESLENAGIIESFDL